MSNCPDNDTLLVLATSGPVLLEGATAEVKKRQKEGDVVDQQLLEAATAEQHLLDDYCEQCTRTLVGLLAAYGYPHVEWFASEVSETSTLGVALHHHIDHKELYESVGDCRACGEPLTATEYDQGNKLCLYCHRDIVKEMSTTSPNYQRTATRRGDVDKKRS
jgi:hypothetical protein